MRRARPLPQGGRSWGLGSPGGAWPGLYSIEPVRHPLTQTLSCSLSQRRLLTRVPMAQCWVPGVPVLKTRPVPCRKQRQHGEALKGCGSPREQATCRAVHRCVSHPRRSVLGTPAQTHTPRCLLSATATRLSCTHLIMDLSQRPCAPMEGALDWEVGDVGEAPTPSHGPCELRAESLPSQASQLA